jgi:hypothetical protein
LSNYFISSGNVGKFTYCLTTRGVYRSRANHKARQCQATTIETHEKAREGRKRVKVTSSSRCDMASSSLANISEIPYIPAYARTGCRNRCEGGAKSTDHAALKAGEKSRGRLPPRHLLASLIHLLCTAHPVSLPGCPDLDFATDWTS